MQGVDWFQSDIGRVACLTDGQVSMGADYFPDCNPALFEADPSLSNASFNAFLLKQDGQPLTLVDAGCGTLFGEDNGQLTGHLSALDIRPEDIGRIIFTHLHTDHFGGAFVGEQLVFPNAQAVLHEAEAAFWRTQDSPAGQFYAALGGQDVQVTDGQDIAPGVTAWHLPGHTPGHMGLKLGGDLVLVGDILHAEGLQLADPSQSIVFDEDPDLARVSRNKALEYITSSGRAYCGGHQAGPHKFATLTRQGASYTKVPL